jgi:hypothetical protein
MRTEVSAMKGNYPKERGGYRPNSPAELAASNRVAVLSVCERLFTVAEYNQLCADMGSGKVDFRMYDDGIVLTRKF